MDSISGVYFLKFLPFWNTSEKTRIMRIIHIPVMERVTVDVEVIIVTEYMEVKIY
jgi:hypothetical protein